MFEVSYMGTWTLGADNATVRNVPEPGPGPIQSRRPIPQLSRINAIRFDGKSIYHGVTFKAERRLRNNYAYNVSYTLSTSKDDASSPGATESEANVPQNVRNIFDETGEWAHSSFDHRHQFVASGVYELPFFVGAGGFTEAAFGGWRVNAILTAQSGAPFTVNLGVDQANIGAGPAQRPDQLPGSQSARRRSNARPMVQHVGLCAAGAVYLRQRPAEQRDWAGIRQRRSGHRQDVDPRRHLAAGIPLGDLQPVQPGELRHSEPHLRDAELRPHLQREECTGDAVRPPRRILGRGRKASAGSRPPIRPQMVSRMLKNAS